MTVPATFSEVLDAIREHTAHLLGATISYDEEDWARPTGLAGWTRSHIAAHLIEGAHELLALLGEEDGKPRSVRERRVSLERRALVDGLQLQIQLDESSAALQRCLATLEDDDHLVTVSPGWTVPAHQVPGLRLHEIVLHHYDLVGDEAFDLPRPIRRSLLELEVERPRRHPLPPMLLLSDEGFSARIGAEDEPASTVIGPARDLVLWLARGIVSDTVSGITPQVAP